MRRLLNVLWKSTRPFAAQAALVILSQLAERAAKHVPAGSVTPDA